MNTLGDLSCELMGLSVIVTALGSDTELTNKSKDLALFSVSQTLERISNELSEIEVSHILSDNAG